MHHETASPRQDFAAMSKELAAIFWLQALNNGTHRMHGFIYR